MEEQVKREMKEGGVEGEMKEGGVEGGRDGRRNEGMEGEMEGGMKGWKERWKEEEECVERGRVERRSCTSSQVLTDECLSQEHLTTAQSAPPPSIIGIACATYT